MQTYHTLIGTKPSRRASDFLRKVSKRGVVNQIYHWSPMVLVVFVLLVFLQHYVSLPIWFLASNVDGNDESIKEPNSPQDTMESSAGVSRPNISEEVPKKLIYNPETFDVDSPDVIKYLNSTFLVKDRYDPGFVISNRGLCPDLGATLLFVVLVPSARGNMNKRMAIRNTWGHYAQRKDVALSFVVGRSESEPPEISSNISAESKLYGDIIAGRFIDSHDNNTIKTTFILDWTSTFCPKVKFLLKIDDDVFMNVPLVIDLLELQSTAKRTIFGPVCTRVAPDRNPGPYYISPLDYAPPVLPTFIHGYAWIFTGDIVYDLLERGLNTPFLMGDDALYAGIIAQSLNVERVNVDKWRWQSDVDCDLKKNKWILTRNYFDQFHLWLKHLEDAQGC